MPGDVARSARGGKLVRAFLLAPLVVPVAYWAIGEALAAADPYRRATVGYNFPGSLLSVLAVGAPVAYAVALVAGVAALRLTRKTAFTLVRVLPFGIVAGMATSLVLAPRLRGDLFSVPLPPWEGALLGALAAAAWWRLALEAPGS